MSGPIQFVHRGIGQIETVEAAGRRVQEEGGVWLADDPAAVLPILDGYTDEDRRLYELAKVVPAIKARASFLILQRLPLTSQMNRMGRWNQLVMLGQEAGEEGQRLQAAFQWTVDIRAYSNTLEAQAAAMANPSTLDVAGAAWPPAPDWLPVVA